jgi:P27 family predicted phage terminase small subunit
VSSSGGIPSDSIAHAFSFFRKSKFTPKTFFSGVHKMTQLKSNTGYRLEEIPPAPDSLSAGAREHWAELIPLVFELGTARNCDVPALVLLCEARSDLDSLQNAIREKGHTTTAGSGGKKANPAQRALEATRRQVENQMGSFGLMPGSRAHRVTAYADYLDHWHRMHPDD